MYGNVKKKRTGKGHLLHSLVSKFFVSYITLTSNFFYVKFSRQLSPSLKWKLFMNNLKNDCMCILIRKLYFQIEPLPFRKLRFTNVTLVMPGVVGSIRYIYLTTISSENFFDVNETILLNVDNLSRQFLTDC